MADCFWTDFVACEEDCGGAPPATTPGVLLGVYDRSNNGNDSECLPYWPLTGVRISGTLELSTVDVYQDTSDITACSWANLMATTDATLAGTTISADDAYGSGSGLSRTWQMLTGFTRTLLGSATHVALSATVDGLGGSRILLADLLTAVGHTGFVDAVLVLATVRDVDTGDTWEASWTAQTCF